VGKPVRANYWGCVMSANQNDMELVSQAISGDRPALERLLLDRCDRLSRHIERKLPVSVRGMLGVEDVLQETFAQVFRDIGRFEPRSSDSFSAWVRTIADHRLQDCLRELKRKKRGGDRRRIQKATDPEASSVADLVEVLFADGRTASQSVAGHEAVRAVQVAIAGLSDDYRQAIRLRYLEGKSLAETAEVMDRTPGAVRGLLDRAKGKMREALGRASLYFSTK
jgi:RNA polymerase sigma-70 factor, ECF subfamily